MKIELEDKDIDRIASAVAAKMSGNGKPAGKAKAKTETAAEVDETEVTEEADEGGIETETTGEDAGEGDFEGEGETAEASLTKDDVLVALKNVTKKHDQDTAMDILRKVGKVSALSKLKEENFKAVIDALNKKLGKAK